MDGKIQKVRLKNIQSWKDGEMVFSEDRMNVLKARNESGKTVLFKVFRQMCFPNFWGRTGRAKLIRRGCDKGVLEIDLASGTRVIFEMYKTFQIYILHKDGEILTWKQNSLPEEIKKELGWYVDEKNQILLNILDLEVPLPFILSDEKFNAQVLGFAVNVQELEDILENAKYLKEILQRAIKQGEADEKGLRSFFSDLQYIDTERKERRLDRMREVREEVKDVRELYSSLLYLARLNRPEDFGKDMYRISGLKRKAVGMFDLRSNLNYLNKFEEPKDIELDLTEVRRLKRVVDELGSLLRVKREVISLGEPEEVEVDRDMIYGLYSGLVRVGEVRNGLADILKLGGAPSLEVDKRVHELKSEVKELAEVFTEIKYLTEVVIKGSSVWVELSRLKIEKERLEKELGVCPLCGSEFAYDREVM